MVIASDMWPSKHMHTKATNKPNRTKVTTRWQYGNFPVMFWKHLIPLHPNTQKPTNEKTIPHLRQGTRKQTCQSCGGDMRSYFGHRGGSNGYPQSWAEGQVPQ